MNLVLRHKMHFNPLLENQKRIFLCAFPVSADKIYFKGILNINFNINFEDFMPRRRYSKKSQEKVEKAMREYKHGQLKIGKVKKKVKNPKQAIAIGLSEARRSGAKVPPPPKRSSTGKTRAGKR